MKERMAENCIAINNINIFFFQVQYQNNRPKDILSQ